LIRLTFGLSSRLFEILEPLVQPIETILEGDPHGHAQDVELVNEPFGVTVHPEPKAIRLVAELVDLIAELGQRLTGSDEDEHHERSGGSPGHPVGPGQAGECGLRGIGSMELLETGSARRQDTPGKLRRRLRTREALETIHHQPECV
jgi:hypothetical protein